ncbi:MAG TPA: alpha/beta hydrolase [Aggregatilineales bacterium]|nr:alpha/beta hydrolase [Aggregatilineales bacterium]
MAGNRKVNDPLVLGAVAAGALIGSALAAIGSWIGYSRLLVNHRKPLPAAIEAERRTFISTIGGALSYYVSSKPGTRPLVLIHSINAAGSAYEMGPIFEQYRGTRTVYALDLPGFGFSDRSSRAYSPDLYARAILDFVEHQVRSTEPVDVVALSLGSEFAALAALQDPERFRSLALISPTGFGSARGSQRAARQETSRLFYALVSFPLWGQAFYDLIATPASIRFFLQQSFQGTIDAGLLSYANLTTHQPGAKNAPLYFVSGLLFTPDIRTKVYEKLTLPVLVIHDVDNFVTFDSLPELTQKCSNWHAVRIAPTRGLPQFEKMPETASALDNFWSTL